MRFDQFPLLSARREGLAADAFVLQQRQATVRQLMAVLRGIYAHQWQKRAMYGIDAVDRLRILERELPQLTDAQFQRQLQRALVELRDLHTRYTLPRPYRGFASIGVLIERCWDTKPHWIVSKVAEGLGVEGSEALKVGAEVLHWNGTPAAAAVARNADLQAGSNAEARMARGLDAMTQRPLSVSPVPDEDWVELEFSVDGQPSQAVRLPWRLVDATAVLAVEEEGLLHGETSIGFGLDLETELNQRLKKALYAPTAAEAERVALASNGNTAVRNNPSDPNEIHTRRPHELRARRLETSSGTFGHLRVFTFNLTEYPDRDNLADFLQEVASLLSQLPQNGLILDVRGNGGGKVAAGEWLLQYFLPGRVQPAPMQLVATPTTADFTANVDAYAAWAPSVTQAMRTGSQYSAAKALYSAAAANQIGQIYHGPVVLLTDPLCYSTTDIFSAGFQDHKVGKIIGVDGATGAGGATVQTLTDLLTTWPGAPVEPLPRRADFSIALLRTLRVGERAGEPLEDLGVTAEIEYRPTRRDVLDGNADLYDRAGKVLSEQARRTLSASVTQQPPGFRLDVTTAGLDRLDLYLDGKPFGSVPVADGTRAIPFPAAGAFVRLEGFKAQAHVASRNVVITA